MGGLGSPLRLGQAERPQGQMGRCRPRLSFFRSSGGRHAQMASGAASTTCHAGPVAVCRKTARYAPPAGATPPGFEEQASLKSSPTRPSYPLERCSVTKVRSWPVPEICPVPRGIARVRVEKPWHGGLSWQAGWWFPTTWGCPDRIPGKDRIGPCAGKACSRSPGSKLPASRACQGFGQSLFGTARTWGSRCPTETSGQV